MQRAAGNDHGKHRSSRRERRDDERGSLALELAAIAPLLLFLVFGLIQASNYYSAKQVAMAAAQEGLREARAEHGSGAAGSSTARAFVNQAGGSDVMTGVSVSSHRSATTVTVTVSGRSMSVIPGFLNFTVTQSASGPVERFTSPNGHD